MSLCTLREFAAIQMVDVHIPTTDGRMLLLQRYAHPEARSQLLLERLKLQVPAQPPRITAGPGHPRPSCRGDSRPQRPF